MKRIVTLLVLLGAFALASAAQTNISRVKGTHFLISLEGDRGYGAGLSVGATRLYGNGFSLSAGLGGEWNQRPNAGGNYFVDAFGEAKYSFLKGGVSPFLAARLKIRGMIPHHLTEGVETGEYYSTATQFDFFGLGLVGVDFGRFSIWGGAGGGPSLFSEEVRATETLKVTSSSQVFFDLSYNVGVTFWF